MRHAALMFFAVLAIGCDDAPTDETPSGALELFLSAMERSEQDPEALREAFGLLYAPARRSLHRRAHFAASAGGGDLEPWEMLVQQRSRASDVARMRERIAGERAVVVVTRRDGGTVEVPLVREQGRWRVVLELPPLRADRDD
jgi:hypothetical protein